MSKEHGTVARRHSISHTLALWPANVQSRDCRRSFYNFCHNSLPLSGSRPGSSHQHLRSFVPGHRTRRFWCLTNLRCRPAADRSLTFAARIQATATGQKIRAANVRERSVPNRQRCRSPVRVLVRGGTLRPNCRNSRRRRTKSAGAGEG